MTIREICEKYHLGQTALARHFNIPLRTVQDWYAGKSNPPAYVAEMIHRLLEMEDMKMNKTYSVTLSNSDCIFDERTGIATIEEAIQWATGRGYKYVAHFCVDGRDGYAISVSCNDDDDFSIYNGWEWDSYSAADLALYLKRNL